MTNILLAIIIFMQVLLLAKAVYIVIMTRKFHHYMERLMQYQDGLADIQGMFKQMTMDHHTSIEETINEVTADILKHVSYINRWQKVIAKMVRSGIVEPKVIETPQKAVKGAEEMHGLGLEIAKDAFDEKEAAQVAADEADAWEAETKKQ